MTADPSPAAEERQARRQAIGVETKPTLSAALGAGGLAAYERMEEIQIPPHISAKGEIPPMNSLQLSPRGSKDKPRGLKALKRCAQTAFGIAGRANHQPSDGTECID